ncbi:MAG: T9SS type A sorting domain-containing protein [Flavobacteriales bacterium]
MRDKFTFMLATTFALSLASAHGQWVQTGEDIVGPAEAYGTGGAVSMPDEFTIAVGIESPAEARIFAWDGSDWVQKGEALTGPGVGRAVSMPDPNTIALGARFGNEGPPYTYLGYVAVHDWNGSEWVQRGTNIDGAGPFHEFGYAVSMPDVNTVAIGAPDNAPPFEDVGKVVVYVWNDSAWVQQGEDILGASAGDKSGSSVSMPSPNTVAIGAPKALSAKGTSRVFDLGPSGWVQRGMGFVGQNNFEQFGFAVSMPDENTVGISAIYGAPGISGNVRIFVWNGSAWEQQGPRINSQYPYASFGYSIQMPDPGTVAVGSPTRPSGQGTPAGLAQVFSWDGLDWAQNGADLNGSPNDSQTGWSVAMPDANTLAFGAPRYGNGLSTGGKAKVFILGSTVAVPADAPFGNYSIHPGATADQFVLVHGNDQQEIHLTILNAMGQMLSSSVLRRGKSSDLDIPGASGLYLLRLQEADGTHTVLQLVK